MRLISNIRRDKKETLRKLQELQRKMELLDNEESQALEKILEETY